VSTRLDQLSADFAFAEAEDATGRAWIIRVPLHDAAEAGQEAELALLGALAGASSGGALPFEVPRPRGTARMDGGGLAIVYSRLPGVPLVMELMPAGPGIAESLGRAIAAFHQLPPGVVTGAGLPALSPTAYRHRLKSEVDDAVRTGHVSRRLEDRWYGQLEQDAWWVFTPVPIHGDMAAEHLMQHSNRISAMTDFASVQVSDPAEDLAQILAPLPPDLAGTIVGAYRARRLELEDEHLEDRAAFLGEIAIIRWLQHGLALDDQVIVSDAREMLADLDRAVLEEIEALERAEAAEAAARAKLEEAKLAAEKEAWERREAAGRASRSAARQRERAGTGGLPPVGEAIDDGLDWGDAGLRGAPQDGGPAERGGAGAGGGGAVAGAVAGGDGIGPSQRLGHGSLDRHAISWPARKPVSDGGVSVWGKPRPLGPAPSGAEPSADADPSADANPNADADPSAGIDSSADAERGAEPSAGTKGSTELAAGPSADADPNAHAERNAGAAGSTERAAEPSADANPNADAERRADAQADADAERSSGTAGSTERTAEPSADANPNADAERNADAAGSTGLAAGPSGDAQPVATAGPGTHREPEAAPRPDAHTDPSAGHDPFSDEPDSGEMTQAFLPDFLKDESEAPADIAAASSRDSTEALERPTSGLN
jgi:aminoglycoside phosphotransferase (APT) family kinase protein